MSSETTVRNGAVTLPVTRSGAGPELVFLNGGGATQVAWKDVIAELHGYETITFDLRGHGKASAATSYKFADFQSDVEAVLGSLAVQRPILIGWSLGADLALEYAATHPVAGLVLVDGAVPLQEPLVEDQKKLRDSFNSLGTKLAMRLVRLTPHGYVMPGKAFADLTIELDQRRQQLLDTYRTLDCPVTMLLATHSAHGRDAHAAHVNRTWKAGGEVLRAAVPSAEVSWLDGDHKLPFHHPAEIARAIENLAAKAQSAE
ncbi:alpha/beta hydrolase [Nocardia sp. NBC_01503]|uniref:alpha/beta fold hydrolase n=1 Tax=Nocardia sp. NBC_01503 TaxID=2975997 RepID=UPI002E7BD303|nr:alpha/beta hydrolase [Nocardia sp. NBC_01503]WTL31432.1 alpha/beta hydrolase [Nocardia sp. NBC_01503]